MTMKKVIYLASAIIAMAFAASCTKASEGLSWTTIYPVLDIAGDSRIILDKGDVYEEPGYSATLDGKDVTDQVVVDTDLDTQVTGIYTIRYSIRNADGFASVASRQVIILDPTDPIEGIYTTSPDSYRLREGAQTKYNGEFEVVVINEGDGVFYVDDLLGGWYCQRAGYGDAYKMGGYVEIDAEGNIDLLESFVPAWGDCLVDWADGKFENGTITYMAEYVSDMQFYLTMSK